MRKLRINGDVLSDLMVNGLTSMNAADFLAVEDMPLPRGLKKTTDDVEKLRKLFLNGSKDLRINVKNSIRNETVEVLIAAAIGTDFFCS